MGLVLHTNSWVTVAEADAHLADKFGVGTTWTSLNNTQKEQALVTAYRWIQSLSAYSISASETAENVKRAQIELAYYIVESYDEHRKRSALYTQGVRSFKISKWSETLKESGLPFEVEGLLFEFLLNLGGEFPEFERELGE
jgi:hypothetical protein